MKSILSTASALLVLALGFRHGRRRSPTPTKKIRRAPAGGRIIATSVPRAEFLVTADRKIQITFLDLAGKPIAPRRASSSPSPPATAPLPRNSPSTRPPPPSSPPPRSPPATPCPPSCKSSPPRPPRWSPRSSPSTSPSATECRTRRGRLHLRALTCCGRPVAAGLRGLSGYLSPAETPPPRFCSATLSAASRRAAHEFHSLRNLGHLHPAPCQRRLLDGHEIAQSFSARKAKQIRQLADAGDTRARLALNLAESPNTFLATVQVGITLGRRRRRGV